MSSWVLFHPPAPADVKAAPPSSERDCTSLTCMGRMEVCTKERLKSAGQNADKDQNFWTNVFFFFGRMRRKLRDSLATTEDMTGVNPTQHSRKRSSFALLQQDLLSSPSLNPPSIFLRIGGCLRNTRDHQSED